MPVAVPAPTVIQAAERGETLLRVPLRLAIKDHPSDEESNRLVYDGAPWNVRLAAKLLRKLRDGPFSSWEPYMKVGCIGSYVLLAGGSLWLDACCLHSSCRNTGSSVVSFMVLLF